MEKGEESAGISITELVEPLVESGKPKTPATRHPKVGPKR